MHGGPDLEDIRGFSGRMQHRRNSPQQKRKLASSTDSQADVGPHAKVARKRSSAYDNNFVDLLQGSGVYMPAACKEADNMIPSNLDTIRSILEQVDFISDFKEPSADEYSDYESVNSSAVNEAAVTSLVLRGIFDKGSDPETVGENIKFVAMQQITTIVDQVVSPQPDLYHGVKKSDLHPLLLDRLSTYLVPSTANPKAACVPNFLIEVKGPKGNAEVVARQCLHNGSVGARALHALRDFAGHGPLFDNNAYTMMVSYCSAIPSTLAFYAAHPIPPAAPERQADYRMTLIKSFNLRDGIATFRAGMLAYRNAREWAKRIREDVVEKANAKAASTAIAENQAKRKMDRIDSMPVEETAHL